MDIAEYIVKNVPHGQLLFVFTSGVVCTVFYNLIMKIDNIFYNKIKDYEEIIYKYIDINSFEIETHKEKNLVLNVYKRVQKRNLKKQKINEILNKIFKKGNKDGKYNNKK